MSANATVRGMLVSGGSFQDISYVPACSNAVTFSDYSLIAAAAYNPKRFSYFKVISETNGAVMKNNDDQILPSILLI